MFYRKNREKPANTLINFENHSPNTTCLDLSNHPLFKLQEKTVSKVYTFSFESDDEIITMDEAITMAEILRGIPPWFTHLNLNQNVLGKRTMEELVIIGQAIPDNIRYIKLSYNTLNMAGFNRLNEEITGREAFSRIVDSLSGHYISVDLDSNCLGMMEIEKLIYLVSTISPDLETLKLSYNFLGSFSDQDLVELFSKLPGKLKYLYLANNDLFTKRDDEEIITILNVLPDSIIYLDIRHNLSSLESKIEIEEIMGNIYSRLKPNIQAALSYRLKKTAFMAQKIENLVFQNRNAYRNTLAVKPKLPFEISESRLEKLIHELENWNDFSGFFIAGLLLEGKIPAQIKRDFSVSELMVYCQKRMHDAISLYIKAGPFLQPRLSGMQVLNILITKRTASVIQRNLATSNQDNTLSSYTKRYCKTGIHTESGEKHANPRNDFLPTTPLQKIPGA